jgi:DNA-binding MarR family transcriptional regulator
VSTQPAWNGAHPDDLLAWTIVRAGHVVGRRFWSALDEVGLNPVQFGVLLQLDLSPGMSNAEIARAVLITPQSMSELMASLEAQGLVRRDSPPGRGHRVPARLTAAGRQRLRRCSEAVETVEASLGLDPEQAAALAVALHQIINAPPRERSSS